MRPPTYHVGSRFDAENVEEEVLLNVTDERSAECHSHESVYLVTGSRKVSQRLPMVNGHDVSSGLNGGTRSLKHFVHIGVAEVVQDLREHDEIESSLGPIDWDAATTHLYARKVRAAIARDRDPAELALHCDDLRSTGREQGSKDA